MIISDSHRDTGGKPAVGAFGDKLRKQREQRGIELEAISNTTKIGTRMLRALEDEHFDQLPGGVFNKGFVRAYARQVGLDEEEAITDYLTALRESQIQQQSILPDFRNPGGKLTTELPPEFRRPDLHTSDTGDHSRLGNDLPMPDLRRKNKVKDGDGNGDQISVDPVRPLNRKERRAESRERRNRNQDLTQLLAAAEQIPAASGADARPASRFTQKYSAGDPAQPADPLSAQIPWGKLAVGLLIVTLALAVWNSRRHEPASHSVSASQPSPSQTPEPATASAPTSTPTQPSTSTSSVPLKLGTASSTGTLSAGTLSAGTISSGTTRPTTISAAPTLSAATAPSSSPRALASASSTEASTSASNKPAANPTNGNSPVAKSTTTTPAVAAKPAPTFTLLIRAEKTTWVSIIADGKPVTQETLIAPAHTSVRATGEVVVKIGNAAGVSFELNGKEIPAQGNEGEVKTYVFDATGLRPPQSQPTATNQ
jgi:cytoskeletal protein RodZ